jgi:aminoglycoside phosphotransferase (APT) family kinase protein
MMHDDEIHIATSLVSRLIAGQFPDWAALPIEPLNSAGTDNAIYRLGGDMAVRLPLRPVAAEQVEKENRWLPSLAPYLPLDVPVPLALGMPAESYPYRWCVCRWLEGENAVVAPIANLEQAALALAQFVTTLQKIDPTGGPQPGAHNFFRGVPLASRDAQTRVAIASLRGMLDTDAVMRAWEAAVSAPVWDAPPVWLHGDIHAGNLLIRQGRISAVIDFGGLGIGDPACDLMVGWTLLSAETRRMFRSALAIDDATWARGRGWALSVALIAFPYYLHTNPVLVGISRRAIDQALADHLWLIRLVGAPLLKQTSG